MKTKMLLASFMVLFFSLPAYTENQDCEDQPLMVHHLKKGGFDKTPVNGAVVFAAKDIEFPPELGTNLKGLEKLYKSLPDAGCNQDVLYNYFSDMQVKNPLKKAWIRTRKKND